MKLPTVEDMTTQSLIAIILYLALGYFSELQARLPLGQYKLYCMSTKLQLCINDE